jgi:hypothetical protein
MGLKKLKDPVMAYYHGSSKSEKKKKKKKLVRKIVGFLSVLS